VEQVQHLKLVVASIKLVADLYHNRLPTRPRIPLRVQHAREAQGSARGYSVAVKVSDGCMHSGRAGERASQCVPASACLHAGNACGRLRHLANAHQCRPLSARTH
jgi:hypothetical protein